MNTASEVLSRASGLAPSAVGQAAGRERPARTYAQFARRRFIRHRMAVAGLVILLLLGLGAVLMPALSPADPYRISLGAKFQGPSLTHPMGTDDLGRDELARAMLGGRVSLSVGFLAVLVALLVGVPIGSAAGYYGGRLDNVLMRLTDLVFAFPQIVLAMVCVAILGASLTTLVVVIGGLSWMSIARLVRASFLSLREEEYTLAARACGASARRIIGRHILPNAISPVIVAATLGVARAILLESAMSYLGLGIQAPVPSWGGMLLVAQNQLSTYPYLSIFPGVMIFLAIVSINFVGDGLRDALDPRHLHR